jgi:hypothetical protein
MLLGGVGIAKNHTVSVSAQPPARSRALPSCRLAPQRTRAMMLLATTPIHTYEKSSSTAIERIGCARATQDNSARAQSNEGCPKKDLVFAYTLTAGYLYFSDEALQFRYRPNCFMRRIHPPTQVSPERRRHTSASNVRDLRQAIASERPPRDAPGGPPFIVLSSCEYALRECSAARSGPSVTLEACGGQAAATLGLRKCPSG